MRTKDEIVRETAQDKQFLTVEEASAYLDISKSALYKKMARREIPYYKPGGKKCYFDRQDLNDWVYKQRVESKVEIEKMVEESLAERGNSKSNGNAGETGNSKF